MLNQGLDGLAAALLSKVGRAGQIAFRQRGHDVQVPAVKFQGLSGALDVDIGPMGGALDNLLAVAHGGGGQDGFSGHVISHRCVFQHHGH